MPTQLKYARDGTVTKEMKYVAEQENVEVAKKGKRVAISLPGVTVGRQLHEGDILYGVIPEEQFRKYKEYRDRLSDEEKEILKEIAEMMRKNNPVWGI